MSPRCSAISTGDLSAAERFAGILLGHAGKLRLAGWIARGHCLQATTLIFRGNFSDGLPLLRAGLAELGEEGPRPGYTPFLAVFARGLGRTGRLIEAVATIDQALALAEQHEEGWNLPELLRTKGELLAPQSPSAAGAAAEDHFRRSLDLAHRHAALSWELRAATSLARLLGDRGRVAAAQDLLASVYGRFSEGFGTADLLSAKALIDELNG